MEPSPVPRESRTPITGSSITAVTQRWRTTLHADVNHTGDAWGVRLPWRDGGVFLAAASAMSEADTGQIWQLACRLSADKLTVSKNLITEIFDKCLSAGLTASERKPVSEWVVQQNPPPGSLVDHDFGRLRVRMDRVAVDRVDLVLVAPDTRQR